MRMRHRIGSKQLVMKGKISSPPRATHKEFTSSKLATARVSKGKSSKKSISGIHKPSPSTMKVTAILPKKPHVSTGNDEEQPSADIPVVLVLRSPPPFEPCVWQMSSPTQLANTTLTDKPSSDSFSGMDMITSVAADTACNTLINVPRMRAATPMLPSWPGSVVDNSLSWSVPLTHPLSRAVTPLATTVTNTSLISGLPAPLRQTSQPRWSESSKASPDLLLTQSSQNSLMKTLKFQIHLKYTEWHWSTPMMRSQMRN